MALLCKILNSPEYWKKIMDVLGFEPRTDRLLASSAAKPHLWLRAPSALSRLNWKKINSVSAVIFASMFVLQKSNGRSGIRTQDRPVMSRLLWPGWAKRPYTCQNCSKNNNFWQVYLTVIGYSNLWGEPLGHQLSNIPKNIQTISEPYPLQTNPERAKRTFQKVSASASPNMGMPYPDGGGSYEQVPLRSITRTGALVLPHSFPCYCFSIPKPATDRRENASLTWLICDWPTDNHWNLVTTPAKPGSYQRLAAASSRGQIRLAGLTLSLYPLLRGLPLRNILCNNFCCCWHLPAFLSGTRP